MFAQDAGYAVRTMRKSPAFTATAIICLALGIGANTAIFTVIHAVLLQPLPYPHADRIVTIGRPGFDSTTNAQKYVYWARSDHGLELMSAYQPGAANLNGGDAPELVKTISASCNYFRLFGANPMLGRTFNAAEDRPGGPRVAILSDGLWKRRFGGDSSVLGKAITLGGEPYSVIGVLPPDFVPYPPADVWLALRADPETTAQESTLTVAARLPPGTTLAVANARMRVIAARFAREHPDSLNRGTDVQVAYLQEQLTGSVRPLLLMLLGAVGLVLLIACANIANLLLARAASRHQEIAIRAAIGAGTGRLVRQFLTESLVLALAGGAAGLLVARVELRGFLAIVPGALPRAQEIAAASTLNPWVAGFTVLLALATGVIFGLFPALRVCRTPLTSALREGGGAGGGHHWNRALQSLVAGEIAIALVLLSAALLMIRTFAAMHALSLGFDPHGLLTTEVSLSGARFECSSEVDRFAGQLVARLENVPGVESAAVASALPLFGRMDMVFDIPGRSHPGGRRITGDVQWRFVTPEYFRVLRIPVLAGRGLADREPGNAVVISQAMARRFWPDTNPVGQTIVIGAGLGRGFESGPAEIVGVAGDVRERLDQAHGMPVMYQLPSQIPDRAMSLLDHYESAAVLVRMRPGVAAAVLSQPVQQALRATDRLPATHVRTMEQAAWDSTARHNFNLFLFGSFAAMALLLAAVGIYGVMAYGVAQRTREIGIRMALGATRRDVFLWVLRQALAISAAGIVSGMAGSLGLTRLTRSLLFGVTPVDATTFLAVPLIALAVALLAAAIPALRAIRTDPVMALRAR